MPLTHVTRTVKSPAESVGRNDDGQVAKSCACLNHEQFCGTSQSQYSIYKINGSKKFKTSVINTLRERGLLVPRRKYLCTACAGYVELKWCTETSKKKIRLEGAEENVDPEDSVLSIPEVVENISSSPLLIDGMFDNNFDMASDNEIKDTDALLRIVISYIEDHKFNQDQLNKIAYSLGKSQSGCILSDGYTFAHDYKKLNFQKQFMPKQWLSERNEVVLSFLNGICEDIESNRKQNALLRAVEQIYYLRNLNLISPMSFRMNLLSYFVTGSKTAVALNGASSPSGGYTTLLNLLNSMSSAALNCPEGDTDTFFDNCQVVGKNHHVHLQAVTPVSVITSVVHIAHSQSEVQQIIDLSPECWKWTDNYRQQARVEMLNTEEMCNTYFREIRKSVIQKEIDNVLCEQIPGENGTFSDKIDGYQPGGDRDNQPCNKVFFATIEDNNVKLEQHRQVGKYNQFDMVQSNHPVLAPKVVIGEPLLVNPNSYERTGQVLDHLSTLGGIDTGKRKWLSVGCDGLPFLLASKLIENTFVCPQCQTVIKSGPEDFSNHIEAHNLPSDTDFIRQHRKYKKILLRPGLGHYEINMVKGLFKLLWIVLISKISKLMGFRSERAQSYCKAASDHHKSWEILQIIFQAVSKELLLSFCRKKLKEGVRPTADDYFIWLKGMKDPNYIFLQEAIFTYILALNLFRVGVRRNNSHAILSGRQKFSPLFYALGMTKYQEITSRDMYDRAQYPLPLKNYIIRSEAVSTSGNPDKGEGGDFILENKNKRIKMWLPQGCPTEKQWIRVNRNLDQLDEVRDALQKQLGFSDPAEVNTAFKMDAEINALRYEIRKAEYLLHPSQERLHTSIDGVKLDHELVDFSKLAKQNKAKFDHAIADGDQYGSVKLQPIFITNADREKFCKIENKTKAEIEVKVQMLLQQLENIDQALADQYKQYFHTNIKRKQKQLFIDFFYEVQNATDEALAEQLNALQD